MYKQAEWVAFHKGHVLVRAMYRPSSSSAMVWSLTEVAPAWLKSLSRAQCREIVFDPRLPPGRNRGAASRELEEEQRKRQEVGLSGIGEAGVRSGQARDNGEGARLRTGQERRDRVGGPGQVARNREEEQGERLGDTVCNFNEYRGFNVSPRELTTTDTSKSPKLLQYAVDQVCGGSEPHYNFLLNCLARLVQYPWLPLGVQLLMPRKDNDAGGVNILVDAMMQIFGVHARQVRQQETMTPSMWKGKDKGLHGIILLVVAPSSNDDDDDIKRHIIKEGKDNNVACVITLTNSKKTLQPESRGKAVCAFPGSSTIVTRCKEATTINNNSNDNKEEEEEKNNDANFDETASSDVEELLWFLLNRKLPQNHWIPEEHIPTGKGGNQKESNDDTVEKSLEREQREAGAEGFKKRARMDVDKQTTLQKWLHKN